MRVTPVDTAPAGGHHVYYAMYAFYLDRAVEDHLASVGLPRLESFHRLGEASGETLIRARTVAVWITAAGRPARWPSGLVEALGAGIEA